MLDTKLRPTITMKSILVQWAKTQPCERHKSQLFIGFIGYLDIKGLQGPWPDCADQSPHHFHCMISVDTSQNSQLQATMCEPYARRQQT